MNGPLWQICAALGFVVLVITFASVAWFVVTLIAEAWAHRQRDRYVPREWVEEHYRGDHPSSWQ